MAKVNDQGTPDTGDDRIVPGAMFEFRLDDGDGTYEPAGDDAPVLAEISATFGFAVFTPTETGDYWVTESSAPPGLGTADPILVHYTASSENCSLASRVLRCETDDDQSGGFLIVVVADSPAGGVGPEVTAPPTDTVASDVTGSVAIVPATFLVLLAGVVVFVGTRHRRSR